MTYIEQQTEKCKLNLYKKSKKANDYQITRLFYIYCQSLDYESKHHRRNPTKGQQRNVPM